MAASSMSRWVGKVAVVTGASAGIGAAIAKQLVEAGINVVGFARRKENVDELSKKIAGEKGKLYSYKVDMTKEEEILAGFKWTMENVGPVSILINNAGCSGNTTLHDGDIEVWKKVLDTNVLGLCVATREAVRCMRENNIDGHIIHINSVVGHWVADIPGLGVYSPSKFAVTSLTETLRLELKNLGSKIKISSVSPGAVETEFAQAAGFDLPKDIFKTIPCLQPDDVANAVSYILSTPPRVQIHDVILRAVGE